MDISFNLSSFPLWLQITIIMIFLCTALIHGLLSIMHFCKQYGFLQTHSIRKHPIQRSLKCRNAPRSSSEKITN